MSEWLKSKKGRRIAYAIAAAPFVVGSFFMATSFKIKFKKEDATLLDYLTNSLVDEKHGLVMQTRSSWEAIKLSFVGALILIAGTIGIESARRN